jgi:response regulator of citrate/malate metabolism
MQNSISSVDEWLKRWSKRITCLAQNRDLSSREIDTYTDKLVEQTNSDELGQVIKDLLNHIRMHK